ncbi:MAG: 5-formyltetrahydrofolate cyclo-ligase [Verrucomicrobiota bacterium]
MQKEGMTSPKGEIRAMIRARLDKLSPPERETRSAAVLIHLLSLLRILNKEDRKIVLLVYANLPDEPSLLGLFNSQPAKSLTLVFPRVEKDRRLSLWHVFSEDQFSIGYAGIREPDLQRCEEIPIEKVDRMVVPGVAFDPVSGARLGRGGGFYDRLLVSSAAPVGVCFDCQLFSSIPMEKHDRFVGSIVTETGFHQCAGPEERESG